MIQKQSSEHVTPGLENVKLRNRKLFRKHSKNDVQLVETDL